MNDFPESTFENRLRTLVRANVEAQRHFNERKSQLLKSGKFVPIKYDDGAKPYTKLYLQEYESECSGCGDKQVILCHGNLKYCEYEKEVFIRCKCCGELIEFVVPVN